MRACLLILFVALAGSPALADVAYDLGIDLNAIVDQLLDLARSEIHEHSLNQVSMPEIIEKFKKKVGPISISGRFEAKEGWAKSLSSLSRTGEATMTESADRLIVDVPLGLSDLQIGYNYKAKLGKLGPTGRLTASVASNSVHLRASLLATVDACSMGIDSLTLTDLGKINVHATGLGELNFLYSKIVTWVTSKLHDKIENAVQKGLRDALSKAGLQLHCESLFG